MLSRCAFGAPRVCPANPPATRSETRYFDSLARRLGAAAYDVAMAQAVRNAAERIGSLAHVEPELLIGSGSGMPCGAIWSHAPVTAEVQGLEQHALVLHLAGSTLVDKWVGGRHAGHRSRIGSMSLVPAESHSTWVLGGWSRVAHLYVDPARLARLAESWGRPDTLLGDFFAEDDACSAALVRQMLALAGHGLFDELAHDELMAQLLPHLLRRYPAGQPAPAACVKLGLTNATLKRLFAHVDDHLGEPLRLSQLAALARLSEDHFLRAFKAAVGQTPHQYVLERRIEHSKRLLATSALPVAEIARAGGFRGASHFAAAFRQRVGTTPSDWRKSRH
jgi:AraC family transcriptional regulator